MALTVAQRQQRSRAKKKGQADPFAGYEELKKNHDDDLAWAREQDVSGRYFGDECRSCVDLLTLFEGTKPEDKESENEEVVPKKKKQRKICLSPFSTPIQIRAITRKESLGDGLEIDLPIEPNEVKYKHLYEVNGTVCFQVWLALRSKARRDLFWLGRMLGKDLYYNIHKIVCDQFVQKNFQGMYFPKYTLGDFHGMIGLQERFANDGTPCREAMILDFRGAYKSTLDGIDSVQWLINAPDIRIMIITGENSLAVTFLQEIKSYFGVKEGAEPSAFNLLFPEYVISGVAVESTRPLICPAKILQQKGKSLWVNSIVASLSGWHPDIKKGDDIVTDENSNTRDTRVKLKRKYDGTKNTVPAYGFSEHIGTRYFTDDWYGMRMMPDKKTGKISPIKYFCRGAWVVKPEYRNERQFPLKSLTPEMVTLTAPQIASWDHLQSLLADDERGFRNQQLNEPTDEAADSPWINHFTESILRNHCYPKEAAPKVGDIYITWDWALSARKTSDYSVGVAAIVYQNVKSEYALCILEIIFDKWKDDELVHHIIAFHKRWNPKRIVIENSNGGDLLKTAIQNKAAKLGVPEIMSQGLIYWKPVDTTRDAKRNRINSLQLLLSDDRLHFVNGLWLDKTFEQLINYTGEKSTAYRKDDIPDALTFLIDCLPKSATVSDADPSEIEKEMERMAQEEANRAFYQRYFGGGNNTPPVAPAPASEPSRDPRRAMMDRILPPGMRT